MIFPDESSAMPSGEIFIPPIDGLYLATNPPLTLNFWILLFPESETKMFPEESTTTSSGVRNCPSPLPLEPIIDTNFPSESNFTTREFPVSTTYTKLSLDTATPLGSLSFVTSEPVCPQDVIKFPLRSNFLIKLNS